MPEEITKAELNAMIDVQAKSAEHLAHIAKSLSDIVTREEKIYNRLYNGLSKEIKDDVVKEVKDCNASTSKIVIENKDTLGKVLGNTVFLKWIYGGLFSLVALAWLVLQVIEHVSNHGGTP